MDIKTLQIKRVTGNWDTNKSTLTRQGEPILIDGGVAPNIDYPIIITGKDNYTIEQIISDTDNVFISRAFVDNLIAKNNTDVAPSIDPSPIGETTSKGTSSTFARADHNHKIEKSTITNVLKDTTNGFEYHGIKASKNAPTNNTPGNVGDIIIVYEDK